MGRQEWERSVSFEALREEPQPRASRACRLFQDQAAQIAAEASGRAGGAAIPGREEASSPCPKRMPHYVYRPVPPAISGTSPASASGPSSPPRRGSPRTPPATSPSRGPALGYFPLSMAKDPRPIIVHEGVPGHYAQLWLSWSHENEIRRRYVDSGPNEGIGFYAEEMLLQAGLFDDAPKTREVLYNFMRLRALRVEVDVNLATGAFTIDEAADYLTRTVPMDARDRARGGRALRRHARPGHHLPDRQAPGPALPRRGASRPGRRLRPACLPRLCLEERQRAHRPAAGGVPFGSHA